MSVRSQRREPIRTSAMYRVQETLGARFKDDAGWRVADVYTSIEDEIARARGGVGLCDVSAGGRLGVRGDAVESLGVKLTGHPVPSLGRASWERVNGVSVLVCRRAADELLLLTPPREVSAVAEILGKAVEGGCVHVTDLTAAFAVVDLMGDKLGTLFERLVALDLSDMGGLAAGIDLHGGPEMAPKPPNARSAPAQPGRSSKYSDVVLGTLAGVHAIMLRLDHQALAVFRVLVAREYGDFVWRTLTDAGHDLGLTPVGAAAYSRMTSA